ncbi:MAG: HEAT repeat domain-containing protein [Candidatus Marinimicrobia bacterium]|jgi:HEAT repeat protein|nr:HEAT repeat domain-containing protein [Candidatus Neomarinimicrobiota bacterium]MDP7072532.1 HEAT repeat domain-containing protein [Candidatus Neomarinimicrobiota bacterium]
MSPLDPNNPPKEKQSALKVIVHSFFVVPLIIAGFAVLVFLMVRILTDEPRTAEDYLIDVKIGGTTKRWQGAFELSKILSNPDLIPDDPRFEQEMLSAFEHSKHDRDPRVRQYLALALGQPGKTVYLESLINAFNDDDVIAASAAKAVGLIGSPEGVPSLVKLLNHGIPQVRLQAVIALGIIGDIRAIPQLILALEDIEPNVRWDAAIALAKMKNNSGSRIILDLLDRNYLDSFPNIDAGEQDQAMLVAIHASKWILGPEVKKSLNHLKDFDRNLHIREAARQILELGDG